MTQTLNSNLNEIRKYNNALAEKISNINNLSNSIMLCETKKKEPNLLFNNIPIHSDLGAENEAKEIYEATPDSPEIIHVIYGLGLGYLFKEFCEKSKGKVILFEPDLEMLKAVFEIVDYKKELSSPNVKIATTIEELKEIFTEQCILDSKVKLHFLNFHKQLYGEKLQEFSQELSTIYSIVLTNKKFYKDYSYNFLLSTLSEFFLKSNNIPLNKLRNKFKDLPAVVISAGPTLMKNIETLKKIQNKVIIICVGTALKTLNKHNIPPDFVAIIERMNTANQIAGCDTKNINLITEGYTNRYLQRIEFKNKFISYSNEIAANKWAATTIGENQLEYETKGTVSYSALNSARIMGCNPIILLGQDLAYTDGKCYADDSAYSSLRLVTDPNTKKTQIISDDITAYGKTLIANHTNASEEDYKKEGEIKLKNLNESLVFVKGQNGELLPTEKGYAMFIEYFKDFALKYKNETRLINASIGGAMIDGYETIPLEKIADEFSIEKNNIEEVLSNIPHHIDRKKISEKLLIEISNIESLKAFLEQGQVHIKNCKRELQRSKMLTPNVNKYLKNALNNYIDIMNKFTSQNILLESICIFEQENVSSVLKKNAKSHDLKSLNEAVNALENFFGNNINNIVKIEKLLRVSQLEFQEGKLIGEIKI